MATRTPPNQLVDGQPQNRLDNRLEKAKKELHPAMVAHQFKQGQSGNPGGRPVTKPITDEIKRFLATKVPGKKQTYLEKFAREAVLRAIKRSDVMMREVFSRIEGPLRVEPRADDITQVGVRVIIDDMPRPTPPGQQTVDVRAVSKGASNKGDD